jgi:phenylalanyl-tRNA synthetase beta chain
MIVTRKWLEEFINLDGISTEEICDTLNSIGQEVEGLKKIRVPEKVVVGFVRECEKHPDADKLNVCQVEIGDNETVQIVCGAKNVAKGQYVAVSCVGAVLPGNFKIKKAKLRGVESFGMICSSTEIGLPKMEDGIMVLDNSIGDLQVGEEVSNYLNDDIIELGITPNRGDSFSIIGIARELSAKFNIPLKEIEEFEDDKNSEGLGRILSIDDDIKHSSHFLKAISWDDVKVVFKIRYRLALVEEEITDTIFDYATYTTVATGVIVTIYDNSSKLVLKTEDGIDIVKSEKIIYETGIKVLQLPTSKSGTFIIDANFIDPEYVSTIVYEKRLKTDKIFFRSSRGSNPNLILAINYILREFSKLEVKVYNGNYDLTKDVPVKMINVNLADIHSIIGEEIDENKVIGILNKLQIHTQIDNSDKTLRIQIPPFRHDIKNRYDIAEEVLRMYGIDTLKPKPLLFAEKVRINETIKKIELINSFKERAVANGFFEVLHFVFDSSERMKKYAFPLMEEKLNILNPIVSELDTLRATLILQMLESVKNNKNNGYRKVALFSVGAVYNHLREESQKIGFVWSGLVERENVANPKPKKVDFSFFIDRLTNIFGEFELVESNNCLLTHPYQTAKLFLDGVEVGYIGKLHPKVAKDFDLDDTFIAEIDLELLQPKKQFANDIIKIQKSTRDLSLVVDKSKSYGELKKAIEELEIIEIVEFYPIDIFDLGDKNSLTIRIILQNPEKSLTDEEINGIIAKVIEKLNSVGVELR